jgi:hypothetical protein
VPSSATITAFYEFSAGAKARATQVNFNFSLFRGHVIPIEPLTATSANITYDLGSTEYRWRNTYTKEVYLGQTSTAGRLYNETTTGGALAISVGGTAPSAMVLNNGMDVTYLALRTGVGTGTRTFPQLISVTLTAASGNWTAPSSFFPQVVLVEGCGSGGGGGGGAGAAGAAAQAGGAGGGGGSPWQMRSMTVTAGQVIAYVVGQTTSAGSGGGADANGTDGGGGASSSFGTFTFYGGFGGGGGVSTTNGGTGGAGGTYTTGANGGAGGTKSGANGAAGTRGSYTAGFSGGAAGSCVTPATMGSGGGGGGAGPYGVGGQGGRGHNYDSGGAQAEAGTAGTGYGAGGGGGGAGRNGNGGGAGGAGSPGVIVIHYIVWK